MDIGVLLKKLTTVIPTQQRIFMYQSLTYEVILNKNCKINKIVTTSITSPQLKHFVLKKRPDYNDLVFSYMMGVILQVLIAGWDEQECNRVYGMITQWLNMKKTVSSTCAFHPLWNCKCIFSFNLAHSLLVQHTGHPQKRRGVVGEKSQVSIFRLLLRIRSCNVDQYHL